MEERPISYAQFAQVEIRVGRVVSAEPFPEARKPAYRLVIDFGPLGHKKSSAQITGLYSVDELPGRQVLAVVNFEPKQIGKFKSEVLVLGIVLDDERVALVGPDRDVPPGLRLL